MPGWALLVLGIAVSGERTGQPVLRVAFGGASSELASKHHGGKTEEQPVAEALGVSVYAKQRVHGHDRAQLERLCRYVMRPPLSQDRLERRVDGRLELTLKNVWKDGTRALLLEPHDHDLLVRLCAAVPPPWFNMIRYFGVLSSHSRERPEVCSQAPPAPGRFKPEPAKGDQLSLEGCSE
jgi:Putative transposase